MSEVILRADGVSKWFGQVIALNDVTVEVPAGVTGLLGPNGAGKSTFLKIATGLLKPSKGTMRVLGKDPWNNPDLLQKVGLAPEHDTFYERMTGREFLVFVGRLNGLSAAQAGQRALDLLRQVGLESAADRRIAAYSKGMKQRAKVAQALVGEPQLLFLDEPLTGTDPIGRREMIEFIRQLGRAGVSVLVSTHVLYEIEAVTRNILLIAKGRILAEGDIQQIRALIDDHPHNVRLEVDRPRELAAHLVNAPGVVAVKLPGPNHVEAETRSPDEFYQRLLPLLVSGGFQVTSLSSPDDNLEAVFRYLVK